MKSIMATGFKYWRESASIIALAKNHTKIDPNKYSNYKILLQKRSDKSGFLPSTVVFPGGTAANCDNDNEWYKHFEKFGIKSDKFTQFQSKNCLIPPILQENGAHSLKRHVSLRITAIREAFEELGILICKEKYDETSKYAQFVTDFDVKYWQEKVHKEPLEFVNLCQSLNVYPDIWSLYLWCNWLTPVGYESQRFDTIFFICGFESFPEVYAEKSEVSEVWWSSPEEVVDKFKNKKIILPPPQWYEISKLSQQRDLDTILQFSSERSSLGCEQIYPILIHPSKGKGWLAIFPGDELYPYEPDFKNQTIIQIPDKTIEELQNSANITHRMELYDLYNMHLKLKNFSPFQKQLSPVNSSIPDLNQVSNTPMLNYHIYLI